MRSAMIAWGLRIRVRTARREEVQRILRALLEPTRVRRGCLACHVYQDLEDPEVLCLVEEWAGSDDLERYLRSEDRRTLGSVMELAVEPPDIWFDEIASGEGLVRLASLMGSSPGTAVTGMRNRTKLEGRAPPGTRRGGRGARRRHRQ